MRLAAAAARLLPVLLLWAAALPVEASPLAVTEVAPGIFVHTGRHEEFTADNAGGIANLAFVIGQRGVAVIDSGGSRVEGQALLEAIRARTALPIGYVINTHLHPDHVLGNAAFRDSGAVFVGHAKLSERLAEAEPYYLDNMRALLGPAFAGSEIVLPGQVVEDSTTIDLGDRVLEIRAWPTAHTNTDLTVLDRATATLFAGDLVFMERLPVVDGSLLGWLRVLDELERLPATRVVPGHGPASAPWPAAAAAERLYLEDLRAAVRDELRRNRTLEQAVDEVPMPQGQHWYLAAENHGRNVTASYTELEWE